MSARSAKRAGFTLIELMIVVGIVAALSAALAPKIRHSVLEARFGSAVRDFTNIIRRARSDALTTGRAQLVWIRPSIPAVRVLKGESGSCLVQDWTTLNNQCSTELTAPTLTNDCVNMTFTDLRYTIPLSSRVTVEEIPLTGGTSTSERSLCFSRTGVSYLGAAGAPLNQTTLTTDNSVGGGLLYRMHMQMLGESGAAIGELPVRHVLVPLSGMAKVMQ